MRVIIIALTALLAAASAAAKAAPKAAPSYTITFTGSGTEHQLDQQQNIQDSGLCDSGEHVDVTATLVWRATWPGFRAASKGVLAAASSSIAGSSFSGSHVKDACGLPLDQAPPGWVAQATCSADLVPAGSPSLAVESGKTALVVGVTAPPMAVPVGQACSINPRNDQLSAHVVVSLKKLNALKRGASLSFKVGNAVSTARDIYAPSVDCSQPTKPYEGYRTADHCRDDVSWSGTLTITRAS